MATNLGLGSVKLPPDFDLQGQNAATEWKFWYTYTAFEDYLTAIGQHESTDRVKLSLLRNIMGTESARIMTTFKIPDDQVDKYDYMIETMDNIKMSGGNICSIAICKSNSKIPEPDGNKIMFLDISQIPLNNVNIIKQ